MLDECCPFFSASIYIFFPLHMYMIHWYHSKEVRINYFSLWQDGFRILIINLFNINDNITVTLQCGVSLSCVKNHSLNEHI